MNTASSNDDMQLQLNHFIAENESLKDQLDEYSHIINTRDKKIESLKLKIGEATLLQSNTDNQVEELEILQYHIDKLEKQIEAEINSEKQLGYPVSIENKLAGIKEQFTYLQTQLSDLQNQVHELNNRNLLLQQQNGRIAELESLLENAERENEELKNKIIEDK